MRTQERWRGDLVASNRSRNRSALFFLFAARRIRARATRSTAVFKVATMLFLTTYRHRGRDRAHPPRRHRARRARVNLRVRLRAHVPIACDGRRCG